MAGGGAVTLDGTASDPEGDTLTYAWTSDGGGSFADASALDTTWTAPDATGAAQTIMLSLTATDDGAGTRSASHTVTVTVETQAAPAVSSVDVTSAPGDDDTYAIGDGILVTVTFDQPVTVTGAPRIRLRVGGDDAVHLKWADYTSGSGNEALLFAYTVEPGDLDDNGIDIAADQLELNGGTIQSSGGTDANLDYPQQGTQSGHNVDGVRPTPEFAATSLDGNSIFVIFSESLSATTAAASAFTLSVDTGTAPTITGASASGDTVTLALASALTSGQVVTVDYIDASQGDDAVAVQDAAGNDAANFTTGEGDVPAVSNAVGTGCSVVAGCYLVSADWGLIPDGLAVGAEFRLLFISSGTRDGASSNIGDYNGFVQTAAAGGHADIQQYSSTFRVVGSTADVDARDNTNTTYTSADKGVAIYWLGGNKVADEYEDFYDETWDDEANAKDESGSDRSTSLDTERPLTGSDHNGTEAFSGSSSRALGASSVRTGSPNSSTSGYGPLGSNFATVNSTARPFYGLSPVFRVAGQVVTNNPPAFTSSADFSANENEAISFRVTAMDDDDGDAVTYAITGGADQVVFQIDATSGQVIGPIPDYENPADADSNNVYLVTVTATGGTGARALTTDQAITVTVTDVDEPPATPAPPTVDAVDGTTDSLSVSWTAPSSTGRPDTESYDLQYRKGSAGIFADGPQDVTGLTTTIDRLDAGAEYQVQVRATNDEGDSFWSQSGSGTTNEPTEPTEPTDPTDADNLTATAHTGKIRLEWTGTADAYEFRRKEDGGAWSAWTAAETRGWFVLRNATTLDDYDVLAQTKYTYQVRGAGAADNLGEASATLGAPITLRLGATEYRVDEGAGELFFTVLAETPVDWGRYDRGRRRAASRGSARQDPGRLRAAHREPAH